MWAGATAILFGLANVFNADFAERHGITGPWSSWPVLIATFMGYHGYKYCKWNQENPSDSYLSKNNSAYFEEFKEVYDDDTVPPSTEGGEVEGSIS